MQGNDICPFGQVDGFIEGVDFSVCIENEDALWSNLKLFAYWMTKNASAFAVARLCAKSP